MAKGKEPGMAITQQRYGRVAILLHWTIAALIIANIGVAWYFNALHGPAKMEPVLLHKSIGVSVLVLSIARLGWRLAVPPPALLAYVKGWEKGLAQAVHVGFYVIMLGLPLSGWAMVSASDLIRLNPIVLFHLVPWPTIAPLANLPHDQMKLAHRAFTVAHGLLGKLTYLLILLHVAGALKHQFISRDDVVARMVPFLKLRKASA
jgi:cytochrome b561